MRVFGVCHGAEIFGLTTGATEVYLGGILAPLDFLKFTMIWTKIHDGFLPVFPGF